MKTRAELFCVQLPSDFVLEIEGPRIINMFPDVKIYMMKMDYSINESICADAYISAFNNGKIRKTAHKLSIMATNNVPKVVGVACTSMSFILGEEIIHKELDISFPCAVKMNMANAQYEAIKVFGISHISILTPYIDEVYMINADMISRMAGVKIVSYHNMNLIKDHMTSDVPLSEIKRLVLNINMKETQLIVIGCSAFRVCELGFISDLEIIIGKPIVTSTQAYLWRMLRLAGINDKINGYGSLFSNF
jgi:maleate cis-trans isomerase